MWAWRDDGEAFLNRCAVPLKLMEAKVCVGQVIDDENALCKTGSLATLHS